MEYLRPKVSHALFSIYKHFFHNITESRSVLSHTILGTTLEAEI